VKIFTKRTWEDKMMKKPVRIGIWIAGGILGLLALWLVINQIDCAPPEHDLTMADLQPAEIGFDNGFYGLTTLFEDESVEVYSPAELEKVRFHFSPETLDRPEYRQRLKSEGQRFFQFNNRELLQFSNWGAFDSRVGSLLDFCLKNRVDLERLLKESPVLMDRYERMTQCKYVSDFSCPNLFTPIPSLLCSKLATRLYIARALLSSADGRWEESTNQLVAGTIFWSRLMASSRLNINLLIAMVNLENMNRALADLMNQPAYPANLYPEAEKSLKSIQIPADCLIKVDIGEYLYRKSALANYLTLPLADPDSDDKWLRLLKALTYQRNQTAIYGLELHNQIVRSHQDPPYQHRSFWENQPNNSWSWWLTNAYGKWIISKAIPSIEMTYHTYYSLLAQLDLLELSAEIHARFTPRTPVAEIESFLTDSGRIDPFSGRPYRFDPAKQVIYSVGRQDLGNIEHIEIPCILFLRPSDDN
jgi:hypothetical protein